MQTSNLNIEFHDPNTLDKTQEEIYKVLLSVGLAKLERIIKNEVNLLEKNLKESS